jgi:hypothetical protein
MFPPAGGVRILIPTTAAANPGGLWVHTVDKDADGNNIGKWVLKNGAGGAHPLPAGRSWTYVAASPISGNTIMIFGAAPWSGESGDGNIHATDQWPDGFFQDRTDGLSPLWLTNDGGDSWFEVPLPVPTIPLYPGQTADQARIFPDRVRLSFSNENTPMVLANIRGGGNFFGALWDALAHWWGDPTSLKVIANNFNGTAEDIYGSTGVIYFGHVNTDPYGLSHGVLGEAIVSANWGDAYGARVGWSADVMSAPPYPDAVYLDPPALQSLDTLVNPLTAIIGIASGDIYYSSDYHNTAPVATVGKVDTLNPYLLTAATAAGIVAVNSDGIYHINDVANGSTPILGIAIRPTSLVSSRQGARQVVAGRMQYAGSTGDDIIPANFVIFDGDSWTTLPGPTDPQGLNMYLSLTGIAVTEG